MLEISLMCRSFGRTPSEFMEIENDVAAWDFDRACCLRLLIFDNEKRRDEFKALGMMLGGGESGDTTTGEPKVEYI